MAHISPSDYYEFHESRDELNMPDGPIGAFCDNCGEGVEADDRFEASDHALLCPECARADGYVRCGSCGEWALEADSKEDPAGVWICADCQAEEEKIES